MGARSGLGFIALLSALLTTLERRSSQPSYAMAQELLRGRRAGSQAMVGDDRQGRAKKRARRRLEKPPVKKKNWEPPRRQKTGASPVLTSTLYFY